MVFTVTAPLSAQAISTTLTEAQASGELDANLKAQGVDATAASVAMDNQGDDKDSPSTAGADMSIVLAICFICVGLVGATGVLMYWRGVKRKRAAQPYKNAKALPDASSPFKNPKSPSPRDGERVSLRSGLAATVDVEGLDVMETTVAVTSSTITSSDMDQLDQLTDALEPPALLLGLANAAVAALRRPAALRRVAAGVRRQPPPLRARTRVRRAHDVAPALRRAAHRAWERESLRLD